MKKKPAPKPAPAKPGKSKYPPEGLSNSERLRWLRENRFDPKTGDSSEKRPQYSPVVQSPDLG